MINIPELVLETVIWPVSLLISKLINKYSSIYSALVSLLPFILFDLIIFTVNKPSMSNLLRQIGTTEARRHLDSSSWLSRTKSEGSSDVSFLSAVTSMKVNASWSMQMKALIIIKNSTVKLCLNDNFAHRYIYIYITIPMVWPIQQIYPRIQLNVNFLNHNS